MKSHFLFYLIVVVSINNCTYAQKINITTKSKDALSFYKKGWSLENEYKLDEAESMYNKALYLDSTFALAHLRLAMVKENFEYRREKIRDALNYIDGVSEAEKLWIKAREDFYSMGFDGTKEYSYFQKLVDSYPNDEIANYLFGFVNIHHGHYEKAINLNANFIKPYGELIQAYIEKRDYKNAKIVARTYLELLPESVYPLYVNAEILMKTGDFVESIIFYNKMLKIDPEFSWALIGISANMNFLGKHEEGRKFLVKLKEEKLNDYEYRHKWLAIVTSYIDEGKIEKALEELETQKTTSLNGFNKREPTFHIYISFLRKTRLYFESNQPGKGYSEYEKWMQYVDNNFKNEKIVTRLRNLDFYYKAYHSYLNNEIEQAEAELLLFNKNNEDETDDSRVLLSRIYMSKMMNDKAVSVLEETDLDNPYNQYWLMTAYNKIGELNKSIELQNNIINLNDRNNIDLALVRRKSILFNN
jgi:tetratricopeptide (TPR) repeat protein